MLMRMQAGATTAEPFHPHATRESRLGFTYELLHALVCDLGAQ